MGVAVLAAVEVLVFKLMDVKTAPNWSFDSAKKRAKAPLCSDSSATGSVGENDNGVPTNHNKATSAVKVAAPAKAK